METKQKLEILKKVYFDSKNMLWDSLKRSTWGASDVHVRHVPYKDTHGVHVGGVFKYRSVFNVLVFVYLVLCNARRVLGSGSWKSGQHFIIGHKL